MLMSSIWEKWIAIFFREARYLKQELFAHHFFYCIHHRVNRQLKIHHFLRNSIKNNVNK